MGVLPYASVAEVKNQIQKTDSTDDATIQALILSAGQAIDNWCHVKDGFRADGQPTAREYTGTGMPYIMVDDMAGAPTKVEVKDSPTDTAYVTWATTDYRAFRGSARYPEWTYSPFRPFTGLMVLPDGDYSIFTNGTIRTIAAYSGGFQEARDGFSTPTVKITAQWGWSLHTPAEVKQACITQVARWLKRGQSSWEDALASNEFGDMRFRSMELDKDIQFMLVSLKRPQIG